MRPPKIRKRYETHEDVMNDDGELPDDAFGERDEAWHERYHIVEDEDEDELARVADEDEDGDEL